MSDKVAEFVPQEGSHFSTVRRATRRAVSGIEMCQPRERFSVDIPQLSFEQRATDVRFRVCGESSLCVVRCSG